MNSGVEPKIDLNSLEKSPGWIKDSQPSDSVITPHTHAVEIPSITTPALKRRRRFGRKRTIKNKTKRIRRVKKRKTKAKSTRRRRRRRN